MKLLSSVATALIAGLILATCGSNGDLPADVVTVVATPTQEPVVITVVASPTPMASGLEGQPSPSPLNLTPTPEAPAPPSLEEGLDEASFWASFPLPPDAELIPVIEGIDLGFVTSLAEPQVFDYYAGWLENQGWSQQAPTEAMVTLPHQRWRKDEVELIIEIVGLDEAGRTQVWVQVTPLITNAPPQITNQQSTDVFPETTDEEPTTSLEMTAPSEPTKEASDTLPAPVLPTPVVPGPAAPTPAGPSQQTTGWIGPNGGPDGARANLQARIRPPLALTWEWGGGENNPVALVLDRDTVYLLTSRGYLCAIEAGTGAEGACQFLWPDTKSPASTSGRLAFSGETVVVSADESYIEPDERVPRIRSLLAAYARNGQLLWSLPVAEGMTGYDLLADQGLLAAGTKGGYGWDMWLAAFNAASGAKQWQVDVAYAPLASDGTNLYASQFTTLSAFKLSAGQRLWEQDVQAFDLAYSEGDLFAGDGHAITCLDAGTGQIAWRTGFGTDYDLAVAHDHVYAIPSAGTTSHGYRPGVVALSRATGQELWSVLKEDNLSAKAVAATANSLVVLATRFDTFTDLLQVLDPASGAEVDRVPLGDVPAWTVAVSGDQVYVLGTTLRVYGPQDLSNTAPPPAPSPTTLPAPPRATPAAPVTGRFAEVWQRLGGVGGRLGQPLDPAVEGTFAEQHFERGLMHWGRLDRMGDPEPEVHVIVYGSGGSNTRSGDLWGRFIDYWQEGDDAYSCLEATPPLGPRRGFGLVWCQYVRDSLGAPLEEERGIQASYQDFEYGTMLWSPTDGGIYVLFNEGDWRFEPVE